MPQLVLHSQIAVQVEQLVTAKPHAILLTGYDGTGKGAVAWDIVQRVLEQDDVINYPYLRHIEPDEKSTISIETVRQLQQFLRLKTIGTREIRRAVIVEHADCMTAEAQNAFLKILEEPPTDTMIVLTAGSTQNLLSTIRSRVQEVSLYVPKATDLQEHFRATYPQEAITQAYFLSGGLPGLMTALLADDESHPLHQAVQQAKKILQQDAFERLTSIEAVKQKPQAIQLCQALERIAQAGMGQAAAKDDQKRIEQWQKILGASVAAQDALDKNANTKLALTHLLLQLS